MFHAIEPIVFFDKLFFSILSKTLYYGAKVALCYGENDRICVTLRWNEAK